MYKQVEEHVEREESALTSRELYAMVRVASEGFQSRHHDLWSTADVTGEATKVF